MLMTGSYGSDEGCQEEKWIFLPQSQQKCPNTLQPLPCWAAALNKLKHVYRSDHHLCTG